MNTRKVGLGNTGSGSVVPLDARGHQGPRQSGGQRPGRGDRGRSRFRTDPPPRRSAQPSAASKKSLHQRRPYTLPANTRLIQANQTIRKGTRCVDIVKALNDFQITPAELEQATRMQHEALFSVLKLSSVEATQHRLSYRGQRWAVVSTRPDTPRPLAGIFKPPCVPIAAARSPKKGPENRHAKPDPPHVLGPDEMVLDKKPDPQAQRALYVEQTFEEMTI